MLIRGSISVVLRTAVGDHVSMRPEATFPYEGQSLFGRLGALAGSSQQENQFSRTFRACFERSPFIRQQILEELRAVCRIPATTRRIDQWECAVEVPTPLAGGGRVDIRLTPVGLTRGRAPTFYLESKLGSPLTLEQLWRYRKHGVAYLIAATKHPPEIGRKEIRKHGVFTVRWQDIHRRLLRERAPTSRDRFIACSLIEYMEELGMAYREDLRVKDLELCRRVLKSVAAQKGGISPRNGFEIADACLNLLRDVRLRYCELHPKLSDHHVWGPGYFNWFDDDEGRLHAFGWDLYKERWKKDRFGLRLWFPENLRSPLSWAVHRSGAKVRQKYEERPIKSMLSPGGTINHAAIVSWLNSCAKRWNLV